MKAFILTLCLASVALAPKALADHAQMIHAVRAAIDKDRCPKCSPDKAGKQAGTSNNACAKMACCQDPNSKSSRLSSLTDEYRAGKVPAKKFHEQRAQILAGQ